MKDEGWVKIHRKIWNNPWMKNPNYAMVWIWILTHAEYREEKKAGWVTWNGEKRKLKKGEMTFGVEKIAAETGVHSSSVERAIKRFKIEEQIEVQANRHFTLCRVKNWEKYQAKRDTERGTIEEPIEDNIEEIIQRREEVKNTISASSDSASVKKEKKKREPQPHYELLEYFFSLKGWPIEKAPQVVIKRHIKPSSNLLKACGNDLAQAKAKLASLKTWAESKSMEWGLETAIKRFHSLEEKKDNSSADEYREWYRKEYGVEPIM